MKKISLLLSLIIALVSLNTGSSQTIQKWAVSYDGAGNFTDQANAIGVDNSGNIYVTGRSWGGAAVNYDYATIKYNSSGVQQWVRTYNGTSSGEDVAVSLAIDGSGNVYVTGYSWNTVNLWDFVTIKYDPSGTELWVRIYDGASHHIDIAHSVAINNSGDIYITGESFSYGTGYDFVTLKYSSAGALLWVTSYNGPGNLADVGHYVCVDNAGNVLVTGHSTGVGSLYDYALVKYNSAGVQQWAGRYDGPASGNDYGKAIGTDASENVYVTGYSMGSGTNFDLATLKYNSAGVLQWVQRYDGPANSDDRASSIGLDAAGNVYVSGGISTAASSSDFITVKYSPSGGQLWFQTYNGPGNAYDFIRSLVVDDSNYVYVTGESFGTGTGYEYATMKYTPSGMMKWLMRYNGLASGYDLSTAIALDGEYNVFVTGYSVVSTNYDYTTVKYHQCRLTVSAGNDTTIIYGYGNQTAVLTATAAGEDPPYTYLWSTNETTQTITVSPSQTTSYHVTVQDAQGCMNTDTVTVFVNDVRCGPKNRKVYVCHNNHTICVDSHAVSAHLNHGDALGSCGNNSAIEENSPSKYELFTNYPNPFNPVTFIGFTLPRATHVKLIIYDVIGKVVSVMVDKYTEQGTHRYEWNGSNFPSGVYFYRLETDDFSDVKKMVLIK